MAAIELLFIVVVIFLFITAYLIRDFVRRFAIRLVEFVAILLMIIMTIVGGFAGFLLANFILHKVGVLSLGFVVLGALLGFAVVAFPAVMLFLLIDISDNTRKSIS